MDGDVYSYFDRCHIQEFPLILYELRRWIGNHNNAIFVYRHRVGNWMYQCIVSGRLQLQIFKVRWKYYVCLFVNQWHRVYDVCGARICHDIEHSIYNNLVFHLSFHYWPILCVHLYVFDSFRNKTCEKQKESLFYDCAVTLFVAVEHYFEHCCGIYHTILPMVWRVDTRRSFVDSDGSHIQTNLLLQTCVGIHKHKWSIQYS